MIVRGYSPSVRLFEAAACGNSEAPLTALVAGGSGFIGSHLCDRLVQRGHRVICVDNL
jgi:UDP-glucuronate decarboxylase